MDHSTACLLLDFYGHLLPARAREMLDLHVQEDLSLGEIADHLGVTRQAVHDGVRRAMDHLRRLEDELGLAARFLEQRSEIAAAIDALDRGQADEAAGRLKALLARISG